MRRSRSQADLGNRLPGHHAARRSREARREFSRFIYASSGSVYGVKEEPEVTEDLELLPISEYNKTKMCGERIVLSYEDDMVVQIVRPGDGVRLFTTACGSMFR